MPRNTRPTTAYPVTLRELEVHRVTEVTPGMRRVTLTGAQLDTFTNADGIAEPAFASTGFDDDIRLLFTYPGETDPVLPVMVDGSVTFAAGRRPLARAYTVRRYDPQTRELDVDFVVHGDGVATTWARDAGPGDRMHIAGPLYRRDSRKITSICWPSVTRPRCRRSHVCSRNCPPMPGGMCSSKLRTRLTSNRCASCPG
ncbi:siderophore-interacting protein [Rhodococcus sp. 5A-K4]|uniref:siderophore-interacting protein n=1 Tax=Rhodococcus sp. 5A-K4 TaxID=3384442 RepID=UPI0038D5084C